MDSVTHDDHHHHESSEDESLPFALPSHDVKIPFDDDNTKGFLFSDGGVASVAYTSCSESVGNNSSYLNDTSRSIQSSTLPQQAKLGTSTATTTSSETPASAAATPTPQPEATSESDHNDSTTSSSVTFSEPLVQSTTADSGIISEASSHLPHSQHMDRSLTTGGGSSLNFSQLMLWADDKIPTTQSYYLPPLVEESEERFSPSSSEDSNNHNGCWYDAWNAWVHPQPQSSLALSVPNDLSASSSLTPPQSYSLMDTMGATISLPDGIEACRLTSNNMEVRLVLHNQEDSGSHFPNVTVREVMDVISNPELLRLWCEPVTAVIVTNASDGARGASRHCPEQERGRMYDGEWIEATTNMLLTKSHFHYLYTLGNIFWSSLGFPSYGKVTLFVERQRGHVGMTLGPFPDGLVASHTFVVQQDDSGGVSIVDKLEMRYQNDDDSSSSCHCNLLEPLEHLLFSSSSQNTGYLEQAVSSMRRLRNLLQEGGEIGACVIGSDASTTIQPAELPSPPVEDTTPSTPLLG